MTDITTESVGRQGPSIHPNFVSYRMSSHGLQSGHTLGPQRRLEKGKLYSVSRASEGVQAPKRPPASVIETTLVKTFQYNPPEMYLNVNMAPTEPDEAAVQGGIAGDAQIGYATTGIEMLFSRGQELVEGKRSPNGRWGAYARHGVAKDILDVYAVVKGDREMLENTTDRSISQLTAELTDLAANGSEIIMGHRVAIAFSEDFILFGSVTSMNFRFVRWNHQLIPTFAYVTLNVDVHNLGNKSLIRNQFVGTALDEAPRSTTNPAVTNAYTDLTNRIAWGPR